MRKFIYLIAIACLFVACHSMEEQLNLVSTRTAQESASNYVPVNGDSVAGDIPISVVSATASSQQLGNEIEKSFDGNQSTIYHSKFDNSGPNYFPITLTYNFDLPTDVDYFIYYPRVDGANNGFMQSFEVQYSADGTRFVKLLDNDFKGSNVPSMCLLDSTVHAKSIRLVVKSGLGSGAGFVSCSEIKFFKKNVSAFDYSTLFTDVTCSELKTGVTEEVINRSEHPFFKRIAYNLLKGTYPQEFRIATYHAYPHPDIQAKINKTGAFSLFDNPTGISVEANENLIVLVGNTHRKNLKLRIQNLDYPNGDGFGGQTYPLREGINKIHVSKKGLVYLMYHTDVLDDPTALPIKIHFPNGKVNGYYDSQKHAGRWVELLGKATDKYFDVQGKYSHLTFETADFRRYIGTDPNGLINAYDSIVHNQGVFLGLEKFQRMFRNRIYIHVMYKTGNNFNIYANWFHVGVNKSAMNIWCDPQVLTIGDNCWGAAHEIGHLTQTRPGLSWVGLDEVTNNIMSEYIQTSIFNQPSRLQTEDRGEVYRNLYSQAWNDIIVKHRAHGASANIGHDLYDGPFYKLVPFWQLELYFGKVLGFTPLRQPNRSGFYMKLYQLARTINYDGKTDGEIQLDFVYNCCRMSSVNLLNFFEKWGFLKPINRVFDLGYGRTKSLVITQTMIDALKNKVNALNLSPLPHAIEYISDNTVDIYRSKLPIVRGASATRTGRSFVENGVPINQTDIAIPNWQNVVAYEVHDNKKRIIFISTGERESSSIDGFRLPLPWKSGYKLFAVSESGTRIEIPIVDR